MVLFFDLDGPLLDVSSRFVALHQELLRTLGFNGMDAVEYWIAKRARRSEDEILAEIGALDARTEYSRERLARIESSACLKDDRCWPWSIAILRHLAGHARLVLVTARADRPALLDQLDTLAIKSHFHEILSEPGGERVDLQKAALMGDYLARHDLPPKGHWMIGDTEADILAGRSLGFTTVAVLSGIRDEAHLRAAEPHYLVPDIRDLPKLLELPAAKFAGASSPS